VFHAGSAFNVAANRVTVHVGIGRITLSLLDLISQRNSIGTMRKIGAVSQESVVRLIWHDHQTAFSHSTRSRGMIPALRVCVETIAIP